MGMLYLFLDNGKRRKELLIRSIYFSYSKSYLNWFPIYNIVGKTILSILLGKWNRMNNYSFMCGVKSRCSRRNSSVDL